MSVGIGAVVIGRNEGERLVRCLESVRCLVSTVVYVDSGSTDDSLARANAIGAQVIELDVSVPFTAARARNAGADVLSRQGGVKFVQFIDGDCELRADWISAATDFLAAHPQAAVVCGRLRERFPEDSLYNRLCDREWDTPVGQTRSCGGIAMMRMDAFECVEGFNPSLIAGEEPELCVRLRHKGWQIWRLDAEMALHDAAMTRFGQWWNRSRRGGYAAAEGMMMHGRAPEYHGVASTLRAVVWGLALPLMILLLTIFASPWAGLLALIYPFQVLRLAWRECRNRHTGNRGIWGYAVLLSLIKFPESIGVLEYVLGRLSSAPRRLIEYK